MNHFIECFPFNARTSEPGKRRVKIALLALLAVLLMVAGANIWTYLTSADVRHAGKESALPVDKGALSFFRHVMEQDYLMGVSGGRSALVELSMISPVVHLSSSKLATMYGESEAANEYYKGKKMIVSGEIAAVRVDFNDDVIVELPGYNTFSNIQAVLRKDTKHYPSLILKGEKVQLYCTMQGKTLETVASLVYLTDCETVDFSREAKEYAAQLTDKMDNWLRAGGAHQFASDFAASYFLSTYLTGTKLPADNPCRLKQTALDQCVTSLKTFNLSVLLETASANIEGWRQWLELRPLARHVTSR